mgnify:FL=1
MSKITFDPDEQILAELSPARRSMFFPVLRLLVWTGLFWMGIGALDQYMATHALDAPTVDSFTWLRRGLLLLWLIVCWRRCVRHLVFRARSRMLLTDRRLITASGHVRSRIGQIPLANIVDCRAYRGDVAVYVAGARVPLVLHSVPYTRKFERLLKSQIKSVGAGNYSWGL